MELRNIQHFVVVAQELSFTKAAERAFISQQALSKSVISLEQELGVPLFNRLPRGLELTKYGQFFLKRSYNIITLTNDTITDIKNLQDSINTNISVGITAGTEDAFDMTKLFLFAKENPCYKVSTSYSNDKNIEKMLVTERLDLGIMGALGDTTEIDFYSMYKNKTSVVVHKDNPLSKKRSVKLIDLADQTFIFSSPDFFCNSRFIAICNVIGFTPKLLQTGATSTFMCQLVSLNQGIMLIPDHSANSITNPDLNILSIEDDPYIYNMHLAIKKNSSTKPGTKMLKEYILDNL